MKRFILSLAAVLLATLSAIAGSSVGGVDPYALGELLNCNGTYDCNRGYNDIHLRTPRNLTINTGVRNLVLITDGQSVMESISPTAYVPVNAAAIDNFNPYDGAIYPYQDPALGVSYGGFAAICCAPPNGGPGGITGRLADLFISNHEFDRVIAVPIASGGSTVQDHATGPLTNRLCVVMARLKVRGIVPGPNVTFTIVWGQGESNNNNTTQAVYQTALLTIISNVQACGFVGRIFINLETLTNLTWPPVRAAQAAVVNGTTVFQGADMDTIGGRYDGVHPGDAASAAMALAIYNAMHASGAPL